MVKQIVRDPFFLQQKSELATESDKQVIADLTDTLKANSDRCVGMAANMTNLLIILPRLFNMKSTILREY